MQYEIWYSKRGTANVEFDVRFWMGNQVCGTRNPNFGIWVADMFRESEDWSQDCGILNVK